MKKLPKEKSRLLGITKKIEDHIMDQSNGLEAKIPKEEIRFTIMMDLQAIFPRLIKIPNFASKAPTSHMRTITQTTEDHMINAQISHSIEMMEIDLKMDLSTNPM